MNDRLGNAQQPTGLGLLAQASGMVSREGGETERAGSTPVAQVRLLEGLDEHGPQLGKRALQDASVRLGRAGYLRHLDAWVDLVLSAGGSVGMCKGKIWLWVKTTGTILG